MVLVGIFGVDELLELGSVGVLLSLRFNSRRIVYLNWTSGSAPASAWAVVVDNWTFVDGLLSCLVNVVMRLVYPDFLAWRSHLLWLTQNTITTTASVSIKDNFWHDSDILNLLLVPGISYLVFYFLGRLSFR